MWTTVRIVWTSLSCGSNERRGAFDHGVLLRRARCRQRRVPEPSPLLFPPTLLSVATGHWAGRFQANAGARRVPGGCRCPSSPRAARRRSAGQKRTSMRNGPKSVPGSSTRNAAAVPLANREVIFRPVSLPSPSNNPWSSRTPISPRRWRRELLPLGDFSLGGTKVLPPTAWRGMFYSDRVGFRP
jgi:hypothetical protein